MKGYTKGNLTHLHMTNQKPTELMIEQTMYLLTTELLTHLLTSQRFDNQVKEVDAWFKSERFAQVTRPYSAQDGIHLY